MNTDINDEMKIAAANALAELISDDELSEEYIIPAAFDERVGTAVAKAVADKIIVMDQGKIIEEKVNYHE